MKPRSPTIDEGERDEQDCEGMPPLQDPGGERVADHLADGERGDQGAHEPRPGAGRIPDLGDDGRNDAVARGIERREREEDGEWQLVLRPVMVSRFWRANGAGRPGRRERQYGCILARPRTPPGGSGRRRNALTTAGRGTSTRGSRRRARPSSGRSCRASCSGRRCAPSRCACRRRRRTARAPPSSPSSR